MKMKNMERGKKSFLYISIMLLLGWACFMGNYFFKSKIVSAEEKRKNISVESILVNYLEQRLEIAKPEGGDSEILFVLFL